MHALVLPRIGHHVKSTKPTVTPAVDVERGQVKPVKRRSNGRSRSGGRSYSRSSFRSFADPHLGMTIESPPLVCYGPPKDSTGALLSGLVHITVEADEQKFDSFILTLKQDILKKRAMHGHAGCAECAHTVETLNTWRFFTEPVVLSKGTHSYPFSFLFPGHLPATTDNSLSRVFYFLDAAATTTEGDEISYNRRIKLDRAILPGPDKHSIRIFPPTSLSATINLPSVVHPGGDFTFDIRLDGVINRAKNTRWKLRKTNWRIEEHSKTISDVCRHRAAKISEKTIEHEDSRIIGSGEMKRGWKSDYNTADGRFELQVHAGIPVFTEACGKMEMTKGISVGHILVVEMIVAEEYCTSLYARGATPTGAARVLRMQFHLTVTSRGGLGISWDEEAPPTYEDVPVAPPSYGAVARPPSFRYACFERFDENSGSEHTSSSSASSSSYSPSSSSSSIPWSITELEAVE